MNKLSLKKLKEGLKAESPETAPQGLDNIKLHGITSGTQFNEISILSDWPDENDDDMSVCCKISF
jgi:hypothetical protein